MQLANHWVTYIATIHKNSHIIIIIIYITIKRPTILRISLTFRWSSVRKPLVMVGRKNSRLTDEGTEMRKKKA